MAEFHIAFVNKAQAVPEEALRVLQRGGVNLLANFRSRLLERGLQVAWALITYLAARPARLASSP